MIEFTFKQSSCVAIGTFNIYIVQPKLLVDMGVFKTDQPVLVSGDLTQPGIRFEVGGSKWVVRPDRLAIESDDPGVDCGGFVEKTLESLCWTPIMAIGINTVFDAPFDAESMLPGELRLPTYTGASQRTIQLVVPHGEQKVNVQLTCTEEQLTLSLNSHTDFGDKRNDPRELSSAVQAICGSFMRQRVAAVEIAKEITGGKFRYERDVIKSDESSDQRA